MTTTSKTYETSSDFISKETNEITADVLSTISKAVTDTLSSTASFISNTPEANEEKNLGLIIGLSVGIPCAVALIIALAVAIFYFYKKQKKPQIKECSRPGSLYDTRITIPRASSNYYVDVAIPGSNEPVYDTVLRTFSSEYETTVPRR